MRDEIRHFLDATAQEFEQVSDEIWGYAETRYEEFQSYACQVKFMKEHGFTVTEHIGGIQTAFKAAAGSGSPVIALLGEFDALPGLSQEADNPVQTPITPGASGHGCGHNLLGAGCMQAACGLKQYLEEKRLPGTVVYYGCPAEESGAGKAFLVREGCFAGVDFALAWHPGNHNGVLDRTLANVRVIYRFKGVSAHAAAEPESGRSALDSCEIMNIGVNYLREHIPSDARVHYAYLDAGGKAPNIVQDDCTMLYAIRAPRAKDVAKITERVHDIARGAALICGTHVEIKVVSAYAEVLKLPAVSNLLMEAFDSIYPVEFTEEDYRYAERFVPESIRGAGKSAIDATVPPLCEQKAASFSTDVGDVSWNVPTGCIGVTTAAAGTVLHHWTMTAQGKSSVAHKGMHAAAGILMEAGIRILEDAELREQICAEFEATKAGETYVSMIPAEVMPGDF